MFENFKEKRNHLCAQARSLYNDYIFHAKTVFPETVSKKNIWFEKLSWTFEVVRTLSEEIFDSEREKFGRDVKTAF